MKKEDITKFFTEAYEVRDEYNSRGVNEVLYNLKPSDSSEGSIIKKIQKMGYKKLLSLKLDAEEVLGYTNLFIYEALLAYDGELPSELPKANERNDGAKGDVSEADVSELNDYVSLYCYDRYNKLSRDSGVNYNYYYDKRSGKYEYVTAYEYTEGIIEASKEANVTNEVSEVSAFIREYINEDYLTPKQVEYCKAVLEYGPSKGKGIYDMLGNLLYTKQQANYYNNEIRARLAQYLVQNVQ